MNTIFKNAKHTRGLVRRSQNFEAKMCYTKSISRREMKNRYISALLFIWKIAIQNFQLAKIVPIPAMLRRFEKCPQLKRNGARAMVEFIYSLLHKQSDVQINIVLSNKHILNFLFAFCCR